MYYLMIEIVFFWGELIDSSAKFWIVFIGLQASLDIGQAILLREDAHLFQPLQAGTERLAKWLQLVACDATVMKAGKHLLNLEDEQAIWSGGQVSLISYLFSNNSLLSGMLSPDQCSQDMQSDRDSHHLAQC